MYRRIVVSNSTFSNDPIDFLYHVIGARLLTQRRVSNRVYEVYITSNYEFGLVVFSDSVRLQLVTGVGEYRTYEFELDIPENQPAGESVEEITETGCAITVFNENGVVICRNVPKTPASNPEQTVGPGEMTSVPGEGPGEMTSVPGEGPGEMTSVPGEAPGEMTSVPGEMTDETTDEQGAMI